MPRNVPYPATQDTKNASYFEINYTGPYSGIDRSMSEIHIPRHATPDTENFILKNGEIRTRPRLDYFIPAPNDGRLVRGLCSFIDSNNVVHTTCLTATGLWQLNPNWPKRPQPEAWALIGNFASLQGDAPFAYAVFIDKFYFTNGGTSLFYWDGITNNISTATAVAGAFFLAELDAHLLMLNTVETVAGAAVAFPQRVRWSKSGVTTTWDPAVDVGAGFNDMIDCPDAITGILTIGRVGYIFRSNGITEIVPVGKGVQPFDFNHLWASDRGIGNIYSYSIAGYGSIGMFIASDNIYKISPTSFKPVGGVARDAIMDDLAKASAQPIAQIYPVYQKNYVYATYLLAIPTTDGTDTYTIFWQYSIEDDNWTRWTSSKGWVTAQPRFIVVS